MSEETAMAEVARLREEVQGLKDGLLVHALAVNCLLRGHASMFADLIDEQIKTLPRRSRISGHGTTLGRIRKRCREFGRDDE